MDEKNKRRMTIRDLSHLLLTACDLNKDVKIANGCKTDITRVEFTGNGEFLISANGYDMDRISVKTEIEVKSPYDSKLKIF